MIKSFKHKGLDHFFTQDDGKALNANQKQKISRILDRLDSSETIEDMNLPGYGLHKLSGNRKNIWSVKISGNWRLTFRFENGHTYDVDLEDYH